MDGNDEQFENYLREFEPRKPRALEPKRQSAPDSWRRLCTRAAFHRSPYKACGDRSRAAGCRTGRRFKASFARLSR